MPKTQKPLQPNDRVTITGNHPWAGYSGEYDGEEDTCIGKMHAVKLDSGARVLVRNRAQILRHNDTP